MRICPVCRARFAREGVGYCPHDGSPLLDRSETFGGSGSVSADSRDAAERGDRPIGPGMVIAGYEIERVIARGGMGVVYGAIHPLISKRVAIKVISHRFAGDPSAVARFVQEARSVNEIEHHNIVDIYSIGELDDGRNFLVMELLEGTNLQATLDSEHSLPPETVRIIFRQLCGALRAVHGKGFVHRDLKPENVLLLPRPPYPFVKILDFGIAKLRGAASATNTAAGALLGTPQYMAPEQCRGAAIDQRTDIYALGVLLYELLTGTKPFDDPLPIRVIAMHLGQAPRPPGELCALSVELEQVVLRCMAKEPDARFPSVSALWRALEPLLPDVTSVELIEVGPLEGDQTDESAQGSPSGGGDGPAAGGPARAPTQPPFPALRALRPPRTTGARSRLPSQAPPAPALELHPGDDEQTQRDPLPPVGLAKSHPRAEEINAVLRGLLAHNEHLRELALSTPEGIMLARQARHDPARGDAGGSLAAAFLGVSECITMALMDAPLEVTYVKSERGYVIVQGVHLEGVLLLAAGTEARLGLVLLELRDAAARLRELITPTRSA